MKTELEENLLSGFQINWIILRDVDTGEVLWYGNEDYSCSKDYKVVRVPKKIMKSRAIVREINFSTIEEWDNLKLEHTFLYKGTVMDQWAFEFGPVVPKSTISWQSIIEAAPEINMMAVNILSGNVDILTKIYNKETLVTRSKSRLYYV